MGISYNISNTHPSQAVLPYLWGRSCFATRTSNSFTKDCHSRDLANEDNVRLRLKDLEALHEKRLEAQQSFECYHARVSWAFNKKVRPRSFQAGDLVIVVRRPIITTHRTRNKFLSKWDGLYVVQEVYTNGAYKLVVEDGLRIDPINGKFLKCYYA